MGKCACTEGWEGNACECPKSNQTCLDSKGVSRADRHYVRWKLSGELPPCQFVTDPCLYPYQGVCNGQGKCVCGRCECVPSAFDLTSTCELNFQVCVGVITT